MYDVSQRGLSLLPGLLGLFRKKELGARTRGVLGTSSRTRSCNRANLNANANAAIATMMPRTRGPNTSPEMRGRILELFSEGWSATKIQRRHPEVGMSAIRYTIKLEKQRLESPSLQTAKITAPIGRPRALSPADKALILSAIAADPHIKLDTLLQLLNNRICRRTLQRALRQLGEAKRTASAPSLKLQNRLSTEEEEGAG